MPMFKRLRTAREAEAGFTLIELLLVIVILAVLAAIVVFSVQGINDTSRVSACKADIKTVAVAAEAYRTQEDSYPTGADNIQQLVDYGLLRDVPSRQYYTITLDGTTGEVTAEDSEGGDPPPDGCLPEP